LPIGIWREGSAGLGGALGLAFEQFGGEIEDGACSTACACGPVAGAERVERRRALADADVAFEQVGVFERDVQQGVVSVAHDDHFTFDAVEFDSADAFEFSDTVIDMDDEFTGSNRGDIVNRGGAAGAYAARAAAAGIDAAENFVVGNGDVMGGGDDPAAGERCGAEVKFGGRDVGVTRQQIAQAVAVGIRGAGNGDRQAAGTPGAQEMSEAEQGELVGFVAAGRGAGGGGGEVQRSSFDVEIGVCDGVGNIHIKFLHIERRERLAGGEPGVEAGADGQEGRRRIGIVLQALKVAEDAAELMPKNDGWRSEIIEQGSGARRISGGQGGLTRGWDGNGGQIGIRAGTLRMNVELADRTDVIAKEFDAHGHIGGDGEHINDAAAGTAFTAELNQFGAFIATLEEQAQKLDGVKRLPGVESQGGVEKRVRMRHRLEHGGEGSDDNVERIPSEAIKRFETLEIDGLVGDQIIMIPRVSREEGCASAVERVEVMNERLGGVWRGSEEEERALEFMVQGAGQRGEERQVHAGNRAVRGMTKRRARVKECRNAAKRFPEMAQHNYGKL